MVSVRTFLIFMRRSFVAMLFLGGPLCTFAASNQSLVYQGRIVRPDGTTPNTGNLTFTLAVYSPSPASCLLYSETQIVSMTGSQGMFSLELGAGTRTDGGSHTFNDVFVNGKTLSSLTCSSGTTYTGAATEDRSLKVSFNDAGTIVNLSSMAIKSVPFALQAHEVDGWGLNNLVKVSSVGSPTTFTTAEMANAKLLTAPGPCATNEILKWNGSAWGCASDATGGTPADAAYTGTKGIVAFDTDAATSGITVASGIAKLSNTGVGAATYGTASKVSSFAVNAQGRITTATEIPISIPSSQITGGSAGVGDVLKWNGSAWLPATDATGTSPGDATYAAKGLVQADTDAATSGLNISSGVISVNSGTGVNQIVKLDASAKLPAVDGSQLTNLSLSQIASGTLPVSKGGTGSAAALSNNKVMVSSGGAIVEGNGFGSSKAANTFITRDASGNFAAGTGTFDAFKLNGATSGTLTITAPSSFTNYSLNFPSADGSAGQFLKTDGAGNLSWATSATPGDATYAAKGIVQFNTDAAASGISLSSGVATVNFGTGANQIVKLDAASKLPAVDGSALTNINANNISSGTLPIALGGTGASTKTAAFDALSPTSAKGDITVYNGTNNISLPRGSDGQVLTTDSAQASGLKWANAATGTVTSVTGGTGLTGGTITSAGTLAVDVGTGANQIVQMTAASKLPAVDGSLLTNLSASQISAGTLPISKGGTGNSSFAGHAVIVSDLTGSQLQALNCSSGAVITFDSSGYAVCGSGGSLGFLNGGNSFAGAATLGTNDNNTLGFKTNNSTRMTIDTAGNVGIGTTSPSFPLHVLKASAANDTNTVVGWIQGGTDGTLGPVGLDITVHPSATGGNRFVAMSSGDSGGIRPLILNMTAGGGFGKVGVGTSSPSTIFDVSGTIKVANGGESCSAGADGGMIRYSGGNLQFCNGSSWQTLGVSGAGLTNLNGLTASTQSFVTATTGTDFTISSSGSAHTFAIPSASSSARGLLTSADWSTFNNKLGTSTSFSGDVSGTYNATSVDKIKAAPVSISSLSSGNYLKYNGSAWVNASLGSSDVTGALGYTPVNKAGDTMSGSLDLAGKNVTSIGTLALKGSTSGTLSMTVPATVTSYTLNWPAAVASSNGQVLSSDTSGNLSWTTVASATNTFVNGGNSFGANANLGTNDGFALNIKTNNTTRMTFDNAGNVGIGISPSYKLDVNGDLVSRGATNNAVLSDGWMYGQGIANISSGSSSTISTSGTGTQITRNVADANPALIVQQMHASSTGDILQVKNSASTVLTVQKAGNVGIGTSSPGAPLDVKGEIRMSGATSGYAGFKSPATGPSVTWTLPTADGSSGQFLRTDGSGNLSWASASSVAITSLNGSTVSSQSFAAPGTSGTAPAWSTNTGTGVHTLNIPMANTASVTAGLISKTEYDTFNTKLGTSTSFSGDVSGAYNATSVDKIKGAPLSISSLSSGNFLKYNGSAWVNTSLASADITGALGYTPVNRAGDTMSGALNMNGQNVTNLGSESFKGTTSGTLTVTVPATVTSYTMKWPSAVAASNGQVLSSDTSGNLSWATVASATNTFVNGGNSFAGAATLGTNDANSLSLETNNTTRMTILSTGNIGIGTTNPGASLEVAKTWSGNDTSVKVGGQELEMDGFSQTSAYAEERLAFYKFRGSLASPAVVQNGDVLSSIFSNGYDGTGSVQASNIRSWVDGTVAAGVVPSRIEFQTMDSSSLATRMTIKNDGKVGINTTSPSSRLEVHEDFTQTAGSNYYNTRSSSYVSAPSNSSSTFFGNLVDMYTSGSGSNNLNNVTGQYVDIYHQGTGTLTTGRGMTVNMINQSTGVITGSSGIMASSINSGTGTISTAYGVQGMVSNATGQITTSFAGDFQVARTGAGSMTTATGVRSIVNNTGSGTLPTAYGFDTTISSSSGAITDGYGIRIGTIQATNKWALYSTDSGAISYFAGNVGIGKNNPGAPLDVKGEIRMSGSTSGYAGFKSPATGPSVTWTLPTADGSSGQFLRTDGSGNLSWASASSSGITSINGSSVTAQSFAVPGTSGTAPAWSTNTGTGVHTLNIPMASASSVTAGLIAKTDYDTFNNKLGTSTSFSGDVSGAYNATSVDKIKAAPVSISSLSSGNFLKYNGSAWVNSGIAATDITSGTLPVNRGGTGVASLTANRLLASDGTGSALQAVTPCSQYQVLSFDGSGNYGCYNISSLSGFINNGNSFGGAATLGTNDGNSLNFETYGTTRMTIDNTGKIGIGTTPSYKFHMLDDYKATSSNYWSGLIYVSNSPTSASTAYTNALEVDGIYNGTVDSPSAGVTALRGDAQNITTKAVGDVRSLYLETMNTSSGKITNAYGILNEMYNTSTGTIGTAYGAMIDIYNQSTGAITNGYGIYLGANGATNKWSIYSNSTAGNAYFGAWVGIGTANPGSPLEIDASSQPISSTNGLINLNSTDVQAIDKGGMISFGGQDGSTTRTFGNVGAFKENGTSGNYAGYLAFATRANGGSPAERMRIDSSGRVGVGTTSPVSGSLFNISSNNGDSKLFLDSYGVSKNAAIVGRMAEGTQAAPTATQAGDDLLYLGGRGYGATGFASISTAGIWFGAEETFTDTSQSSAIMFETTPTGSVSKAERMRITGSGNVGIGTISPSFALHVKSSDGLLVESKSNSFSPILELRDAAATPNRWEFMSGYGSPTDGKLTIYDATRAYTRLVIDTSGNVGIGATAPSTLMHILNNSAASTSGQDSLTLGAAMNGGTVGSGARIVFAGTSGAPGAAIRGYTFGASSTGLGFDTGWNALTTKMVITNAGDVGVGTTSPARRFHVAGDGIKINNSSGNAVLEMAANAGNLYRWMVTNSDYELYDATNSVARLVVLNSGNVGIGTTNPSYNLHVVGTAGLSTGTAWTNASDIRLKDIDGDYEYGLDEILKLHTVRFHYKKDNALNIPSEHPMTGFIAQEVQKVIPDAVHVRDDGYLELNVDPIHWATVNAVQQLHGMCKMTETQMQAIKAKVESHDRRIASVENVNRRLESENEILKKKNEELEKQLARQAKDLELIKKKLGL